MTASDEGTAATLALISAERIAHDDKPAVVGWLQRLCRAAERALPATGVAITLMSDGHEPLTAVASSSASAAVEELQFTLGEGPCLDAHASRAPVLIADVSDGATVRWPAYAEAVGNHGVRAVFAFPMQVGAARMGVLDVYRDTRGPMSPEALAQALAFAEVALTALLDAQRSHDDAESVLEDAVDSRLEVYQAQGMVMVQLGVDIGEAMVRLRAYAYAHDRRIGELAREIVSGKLNLSNDDR
ncbi:MAG TPA: GAF and ANTAR domain-containing protein [Nocardioidaceae bacterium]|nr:GAF and ANTAR domain-containing protein [Nocardioidaceae bacterium]